LVRRHSRRLAGGAHRYQASDAAGDLVADEATQRLLVERQVGAHRRHQRRVHALQTLRPHRDLLSRNSSKLTGPGGRSAASHSAAATAPWANTLRVRTRCASSSDSSAPSKTTTCSPGWPP